MEALTVRQVHAEALRPMLQALERDKTDTTSGAVAACDVCGPNAQGFEVLQAGVVVGCYLLQVQQYTKKVCWVLGAAGGALGHDMVAEVLPMIEAQAKAAGAEQVAFTSKRRGLEQKITASGFKETGRVYRKNLL